MRKNNQSIANHSTGTKFSDDNDLNNLMLNSNPNLIYCFDNNGRFSNVNKALCNALKMQAKDIIGKTYYELGFPEFLCKSWDGIRASVKTTGKKLTTISSVSFDGKTYFFKLYLFPLKNDTGKHLGIGVITSDITEYKETKEELKEKHNDFLALIEDAPDIIAIHAQGKFLYINKKGLEIAKANSREDIVGKSIWTLVHPDSVKIAEQRIIDIQSGKKVLQSVEQVYICLDGTPVDVEVRSISIRFQGKDAILIIARDIGERKKAAEALKREHSLLRTIIDLIPDSIYVKDSAGRKIIANKKDLQYMGATSEDQITGKLDEEIFIHNKPDPSYNYDQKVLDSGNASLDQIEQFIDNQNQKHWLISSKVPFKNEKDEVIGLVGIGKNITESKEMLDRLSKSEDRLQKIILSSSDCIWEMDQNSKFVYCSEKIESILGYDPQEVIGRSAFDFLSDHETRRILPIINDIIDHKKNMIEIELCFTHKMGNDVFVVMNGHPAYDSSGNYEGYIGIIKDITERKLKENKIKDLNDKLVNLIEAMPDVIIFKDREGRWSICNAAAKKLFKLKETDWLGKTDQELENHYPEQASVYKAFEHTDESVWQQSKLLLSSEIIQLKNGNILQFDITKVPIYDENKRRKGLAVIGRDISKAKKEEQQLKLLETVITNTTDGVIITEAFPYEEPGPKIIYVNDAYLKITGYKREEVIGQTPRILQGPDTDKNELYKMKVAIENNLPCEIEVINYKKNGQEFWSSIAISPVRNQQGIPVYWIAIKRDITENKRQEQNIKKALITGQENEKYFIGRELHDNIAQLLVGAILSLSMVRKQIGEMNPLIKQTSDELHDIIGEIRDLSHSLAPASFKDEVFKNIIERLLKKINRGGQYIITTHYDDLEKIQISSELKLNLYRIIQEQLQNIIKHSDASSIELSLRVFSDLLRLRIFDNGKGFDPHDSTSGIGLQNIKNRAEIFSGHSIIRSSKGNGCELIVKIPIAEVPADL